MWRLNYYWLGDEIVQGECRKGIVNYWTENMGTVDPLNESEAFKTTLRGTFMSIIGILRKDTQQHTVELEASMLSAENAYAFDPSPDNRDTWLQCRRRYKLRLLDSRKNTCYMPHKNPLSMITRLAAS